jgi:hypothetical protein
MKLPTTKSLSWCYVQHIISRGHTDAYQGALCAVLQSGLKRGGLCPKDRQAKNDPISREFRLEKSAHAIYEERAKNNIEARNDMVTFFNMPQLTRGNLKTLGLAELLRKPCLHVSLEAGYNPALDMLSFVAERQIQKLEVAGSHEIKEASVSKWEEGFLAEALSLELSIASIVGPNDG